MANKTNVMRILDQAKIPHKEYDFSGNVTTKGTEVAAILGIDPDTVFKTLVTRGSSKNYYVFVIPVAEELNLKKAAKAAKEKSIEMIAQKELLPLTGYIHGGCSPVGMKKFFPTFIEETAQLCKEITFSAGKVGFQVQLPPEELKKVINFEYADLVGLE